MKTLPKLETGRGFTSACRLFLAELLLCKVCPCLAGKHGVKNHLKKRKLINTEQTVLKNSSAAPVALQ